MIPGKMSPEDDSASADDLRRIEEKFHEDVVNLKGLVKDFSEKPSQALIDKTMVVLMDKLEDRDQIINLQLKNTAASIKMDIQSAISKAHESLEKRMDRKIRDVIEGQKEKISWGIEILRFAIVAAMFILSIKFAGA